MNRNLNEIMRTWTHDSKVKITLVYGDITVEDVDAIVNAANRQLQHGGGVAKAISDRGGPVIQEESNDLAPINTGDAVITGAGDLPARWVIHAVGPRWGEGDEDDKLSHTVKSVLEAANIDEYGIETLSMPAISTGIYSFPVDRAAGVIMDAIRKWLDNNPETRVTEIRLCLFDRQTLDAFDKAFVENLGEGTIPE